MYKTISLYKISYLFFSSLSLLSRGVMWKRNRMDESDLLFYASHYHCDRVLWAVTPEKLNFTLLNGPVDSKHSAGYGETKLCRLKSIHRRRNLPVATPRRDPHAFAIEKLFPSKAQGRRLQFGVAVVDNKIYVVGGRDGLKTLSTVLFPYWESNHNH